MDFISSAQRRSTKLNERVGQSHGISRKSPLVLFCHRPRASASLLGRWFHCAGLSQRPAGALQQWALLVLACWALVSPGPREAIAPADVSVRRLYYRRVACTRSSVTEQFCPGRFNATDRQKHGVLFKCPNPEFRRRTWALLPQWVRIEPRTPPAAALLRSCGFSD